MFSMFRIRDYANIQNTATGSMRNSNQAVRINSNRRITRSATAVLSNQILARTRVTQPEGYTKNIEKNTTLICMNCEVKLKDRLFALDCGHVSCGECQSQFKTHKKSCPGCGKKTKQILQLFA
ncbi:21060_t:CDS:2 [Entrophospora sp. SA101]|nr:15289_t:CDS:2 [Entrophospora sp. SA101]CAJ0756061.1 21060_t:CDS:2 [Entrophospora sp. SA101]CAJ0850899.1 4491_t:CDS:2 [Entrophospora sp. SA101]